MYKGFFHEDLPHLYCQVVSVKQLTDFFEADFKDVSSVTIQNFIKQYDFKDIFSLEISENVLEGKASFDFVNERELKNGPFPSNSRQLFNWKIGCSSLY